MADPTLKRAGIVLKYTASDGYRMEFDAKGGTGTQHRVTGEEVPPEKALLAGLAELSRILTLFGFEVEAQKVFGEARQAVHEWRAHLKPKDGVAPAQAPSITDEGLSRRFTRCAYPGPNPMYRCNACGAEEYGVRNLLVKHALACGVARLDGQTPPPSGTDPMEQK